MLDLILIGTVFIYFFIGFTSGIIKQLCDLLGTVLSIVVGYYFYKRSKNLLLLPVVTIVASLLFNLILYVIKKVWIHMRKEKLKISLASRIAGGLFGGFKGIAIVLLALFCLNVSSAMVQKINPLARYLDASKIYSHFKNMRMFSNTPVVKKIYYLGQILKEGQESALGQDESVIALRENPSLKSVLEDKELMQSIQKRDYQKILSRPKFINLLKDKEFLQQLSEIDYEAIFKKQIQEEKE